METAERLQRQIGTLNELHGIVRTMKALSAVSIRQYENATQSLSQYSRNVNLGLHALLRDMGREMGRDSARDPIRDQVTEGLPANANIVRKDNTENSAPATNRRRDSHQLSAIIFGADHGMCGSFNDNISGYALQYLRNAKSHSYSGNSSKGTSSKRTSFSEHRILTVGARVASILKHSNISVEENIAAPSSAEGITSCVHELLVKIDEWRAETDNLDLQIFYNRRRGVDGDSSDSESDRSQAYRPSRLQLLPVNLNRFRDLEQSPWPSRHLPCYSMQPKALISALLRQYFFVALFKASAESQASEHASRLNTMQAAEKNLAGRLEQVKTQFRRVRQEAITTELLDLVSGFETIMEE